MGPFFSKRSIVKLRAIRLPVFVTIRTFLKLAIGSRRIMTNRNLPLSFLFVFGKAAVGSHPFLANDLFSTCGAIRPPAFLISPAFPKSAVGSYMCVRMCVYVCTYVCIYIYMYVYDMNEKSTEFRGCSPHRSAIFE